MPRQPANLKRYQVVGAFLALVVAFTVACVALNDAIDANSRLIRHDTQRNQQTAELARETHALAKQLAEATVQGRKLRAEQLAALHRQAVASCKSRHTLVEVVSSILRTSIRRAQANPIPGATPEQQAAIDRAVQEGIATATDGINQLSARADCRGVPPLPTKKLPPVPANG